jgi:signal transduction histidine kinase
MGTWDADRLSQVFSNLLANAVQYGTLSHGVTIEVDGRSSEDVRVQITNMGEVPPRILPRLFEPMAGGQRRRDRSQGLGLGLYITREIVHAHGGEIAVQSDPASGTTMTVVLPRTFARA